MKMIEASQRRRRPRRKQYNTQIGYTQRYVTRIEMLRAVLHLVIRKELRWWAS